MFRAADLGDERVAEEVGAFGPVVSVEAQALRNGTASPPPMQVISHTQTQHAAHGSNSKKMMFLGGPAGLSRKALGRGSTHPPHPYPPPIGLCGFPYNPVVRVSKKKKHRPK